MKQSIEQRRQHHQTREDRRRGAMESNRDAVARLRGQIKRLEKLMAKPLSADEKFLAAIHDIDEDRRELIGLFGQKIKAHERDIVNLAAKLGIQA